jgi:uncharacterized protein
MKIRRTHLFTLILAFFILNSCAQNKNTAQKEIQSKREKFWQNLPKPVGWTNDWANLYNDKEEQTLDSLITFYTKKTTIQIALVTIDTNSVSKEKFEDLTLHIAKTWGVGLKGKDNGVLIGISPGYRTIRIQNGYGIEKLISDNETKKIIDSAFIPPFKKGQYFQGTVIGLTELMKLLDDKLGNSKQ